MTVLVSSPEQDKPVRTLWSIEDYIRDPAGATTLNTSSIKTLNGDMSVTALLHISSSSSSSSYQETVEQLTAQEHVQTDSVDHSKRNGLLTVNKEYVFFYSKFRYKRGQALPFSPSDVNQPTERKQLTNSMRLFLRPVLIKLA